MACSTLFDYRTQSNTIIYHLFSRLSAIAFWFDFVRLDTPGKWEKKNDKLRLPLGPVTAEKKNETTTTCKHTDNRKFDLSGVQYGSSQK